jgi:uncharacterized membrane-anchored protein
MNRPKRIILLDSALLMVGSFSTMADIDGGINSVLTLGLSFVLIVIALVHSGKAGEL